MYTVIPIARATAAGLRAGNVHAPPVKLKRRGNLRVLPSRQRDCSAEDSRGKEFERLHQHQAAEGGFSPLQDPTTSGLYNLNNELADFRLFGPGAPASTLKILPESSAAFPRGYITLE